MLEDLGKLIGYIIVIAGVILATILVVGGIWYIYGWAIIVIAQGLSDVFGWGWELPFTAQAYFLVGAAASILTGIFGGNRVSSSKK